MYRRAASVLLPLLEMPEQQRAVRLEDCSVGGDVGHVHVLGRVKIEREGHLGAVVVQLGPVHLVEKRRTGGAVPFVPLRQPVRIAADGVTHEQQRFLTEFTARILVYIYVPADRIAHVADVHGGHALTVVEIPVAICRGHGQRTTVGAVKEVAAPGVALAALAAAAGTSPCLRGLLQ